MGDIRYTTTVLDDFNRANENPIQTPWLRAWTSGVDCELRSNAIGSPFVNPASSAQNYLSTAGPFDGNQIENWADARGSAAQADSYRMGLCDDAAGMNGYVLRCENPVGADKWAIRRYTNGIATQVAIVSAVLPQGGQMVLMQLDATTVSCYRSTDSGANWSLVVDVVDTTYRSNLFLHLGANGSGPGWDNVGGGVPGANRPQIYRILRGFDQ